MMEKVERLYRHAKQCRALADSALRAEARKVLLEMAQEYEDRATSLQAVINGRTDPPFLWSSSIQ